MEEIVPGVWYWQTYHERIEAKVSSYYLEGNSRTLIDPRVPDEGLAFFRDHGPPEHAVLTNRHHYRHTGQFVRAFGVDVRCHRAGLHEFQRDEPVIGFEHGQTLPGGAKALEVASLCPEETAFFFADERVLALGDSVVRDGEDLAFVPDEYMGDDPEEVKRGLYTAFQRLLALDFDVLLLAHGVPIVREGKEALAYFVHARRTRRRRAA